MGSSQHLVGDLESTIEFYHQALSRKPDDPFASEMLNRALYEALDNMAPTSTNDTTPKPPANQISMSMGTTMSTITFQGGNNMMINDNGISFFSPEDSDIDMSMS